MVPHNSSVISMSRDGSVEEQPAGEKRRTMERKSMAAVPDSDSDNEEDLPMGGRYFPSSPPLLAARTDVALPQSSGVTQSASPARGSFVATPSRKSLQDFMLSNSKRIRATVDDALGHNSDDKSPAKSGDEKSFLPSSPLTRMNKGKRRAVLSPSISDRTSAVKPPRPIQITFNAAHSLPNILPYIDNRKAAREAANEIRLAKWQAEKLAQQKKLSELIAKRKIIGNETDIHIVKALEKRKRHLVLIFGNNGSKGNLPGRWNVRRATWGRRGEAEKLRSKNRRAKHFRRMINEKSLFGWD